MTPWTPELLTAAIVERRLEGEQCDCITFEGTTGRGVRTLVWYESFKRGFIGATNNYAEATEFCAALNEAKARIYVDEEH